MRAVPLHGHGAGRSSPTVRSGVGRLSPTLERSVFDAGRSPAGGAGHLSGPSCVRFTKGTPGAFRVEGDSADRVRLVLSLDESCVVANVSGGRRGEASPKAGAVSIIPPGTRYGQTITGVASALLFEFSWRQLSDWMTCEADVAPERVQLEARLCVEDDALARSLFALAGGAPDRRNLGLHGAFERLILAHSNRPGAGRDARAVGGLTPRHVKRVTDLIEDRLCEGVSVDDMAREVGLSAFHFLRAFKATLGKTPHRHLSDRRAGRALEALLDRKADVEGIAARTGFSHGSHLSKVLKRRFGVTPTDFRKTLSSPSTAKRGGE